MSVVLRQAINGLMIGSADQKALGTILSAVVDDLETLRAKQAAMGAKLDADAGVTDTNYTSLTTVAAGGLSVSK